MIIIYQIVFFISVFIGNVKSDCLNGTSIGCKPNEICLQNQCYLTYGPCIDGRCGENSICVANNCLNLLPIITTTQRTTKPPCLDYSSSGRFSDCPSRAYLCNNPFYYNLMTQQCPRTCNRCPNTYFTLQPTIPGCFDRSGSNGKSNCVLVAHLCRNPLYINLMKEQCARTSNNENVVEYSDIIAYTNQPIPPCYYHTQYELAHFKRKGYV
ncbi:Uncharacterized protein ACO02O_07283 [Dirofilaria immitis]